MIPSISQLWRPGEPMKNDIISADGVRKTFTTYKVVGKGPLAFAFGRRKIPKRALRGVSFGIREGELVALLGKNGSGKVHHA